MPFLIKIERNQRMHVYEFSLCLSARPGRSVNIIVYIFMTMYVYVCLCEHNSTRKITLRHVHCVNFVKLN